MASRQASTATSTPAASSSPSSLFGPPTGAPTPSRKRATSPAAKLEEKRAKLEEKRRLAEQRAREKEEKAAEKAAEKASKARAKAAAKAAKATATQAAKAASAAAKAARAKAKAAAKAAAKAVAAKAKPRAKPGAKAAASPKAKRAAPTGEGSEGTPPSAKRQRVAAQDVDVEVDFEDGEALEVSHADVEKVLGGASAIAKNKAAFIGRMVGLEQKRVAGAVKLFEEGNTLPFIARYRKEQTGSLDEEQLRLIERELGRVDGLEARRGRVALALYKKGALTDDLKAVLLGATVMEEIEDVWAPFKAKKKTRAQVAEARGLAPLAELIEQLGAGQAGVPPEQAAQRFVSAEKEVPDATAALAGARDIVAERGAHRADIKDFSRQTLEKSADFVAKRRNQKVDEEGKYKAYWEFSKRLKSVQSYQFLAAQRGESEKCLTVGFSIQGNVAQNFTGDLSQRICKRGPAAANSGGRGWAEQLRMAAEEAYKRLILPSLEREWRRRLKEKAEDEAFDTFRRNLYAKLMLPPLRMHPEWGEASKEPVMGVLGIDPGFRTGCKMALIAMTGQVVATKVAYLHNPPQASAALKELLSAGLGKGHGKSAEAPRLVCSIGNGTASSETEAWVRNEIRSASATGVAYSVVDEAGASIYSASPLASKELPDMDVSLRGAVSIARRLLDPLSELVKIDPQSIGVGLYQHDVDQKRLGKELKAGTEDCVNAVGVDLNTASPSLLGHVAGLSDRLAKAIVSHREEKGFFANRQAVMDVKGLGQKSFHQAAGFLRVHGGDEPLDALPVHPESYGAARALTKRCGARMEHLAELGGAEALAPELGVGPETLTDIAAALAGSEIDPRKEQPSVRVKPGLGAEKRPAGAAVDANEAGITVDQLEPGLLLEAVVRNVVPFGAFVDIGVGHDALLHSSQYPRHLQGRADGLHVNDRIEVRVLTAESSAAPPQGKDGGKGSKSGGKPGKKPKWKISVSMRDLQPGQAASSTSSTWR